jgi:hypothetical protein
MVFFLARKATSAAGAVGRLIGMLASVGTGRSLAWSFAPNLLKFGKYVAPRSTA